MKSLVIVLMISFASIQQVEASLSSTLRQSKLCTGIIESAVYQDASEGLSRYWQDMVHTRFTRLVLAPALHDPQFKLKGLVTKEDLKKPIDGDWLAKTRYYFVDVFPHKLGRVLAREQGYRFTPFRPIEHYLIDLPTQKVVYELTYAKRRLSLPVKILGGIALYIASWDSYYDWAATQASEKGADYVTKDVVLNRDAYLRLINEDYRYKEIQNWRKAGVIVLGDKVEPFTEDAAVNHAQAIYLSFESYYKLRDTAGIPDNLDDARLMYADHPLFEHLKNYTEQELKSQPGIHVKNPGMITAEQEMDIYDLTHVYLSKIQYLEGAFQNKLAFFKEQESLGDKATEAHKMVFGPEVVRYLLSKTQSALQFSNPQEDEKVIVQLKSFILEYMYWEYAFQLFQAVGIEPLLDSKKPYSASNRYTFEEKRIALLIDFLNRMGKPVLPPGDKH